MKGYALASDFASRPRKRVRRTQRKRVVSVKRREEKRLYFDCLPEGANENVVRCLSRAPQLENWPAFLEKGDIAAIYNAAGELGRFASSRFTCILIAEKDQDKEDEVEDDIPEEDDNWIDIRDKKIGGDLLMRGASTFKKIYVDSATAKKFLTSNMLDEIYEKCPNVECLYLPSEGGRAWLERFGNRLRTLEFHSRAPRTSIVAIQFCSNVRQLTLKKLNKYDVTRTNVWAKIGETLEHLSIKFTYNGEEQIRNIETHCRKLKHIDISGLYNMAALPRCLASYENQLEYAAILATNINAAQLGVVVDKCTKARFKLVFEEYVAKDYLCLLGRQLVDVEIGRLNKRVQLRSGWNLCTNLEKLTVHAPTRLTDVQALLSTPKPTLKEINLDLHKRDGNVKSVMDAFANGGITTLETVWLKCFTPPPKSFDRFVDTNKDLSSVSILLKSRDCNPSPISQHETREIAEGFLKSASLKRLDVHNYDGDISESIAGVEEMCGSKHRFRRIRVSLLNYDYM